MAKVLGAVVAVLLLALGAAWFLTRPDPAVERYCQAITASANDYQQTRSVDVEAGSTEEFELVTSKNRALVDRRDAAPDAIKADWVLVVGDGDIKTGALAMAERSAALERIDAYTATTCGSSDIFVGLRR